MEQAWNNLYVGDIHGVASTLSLAPLLEDAQRANCGVLLRILKS
jgi:hypothetical protein